ncbi:predicted protein [Histoplasma capsulatum G186AR]|uniref:Uncharacterized protein n=1 Tax=Ajellomyces capsulatus (strain G186AR / H82 / ATCC MYA-2454 / RMSCC 2432) TaxID=447093 RepID=C0NHH3_AJECG|nr:uncharacterized protein HCBG_02795 [Histoplasma capsulatum G186AR]EEH09258.1 predicted protein [Histoplasma capsulatum G186AR]
MRQDILRCRFTAQVSGFLPANKFNCLEERLPADTITGSAYAEKIDEASNKPPCVRPFPQRHLPACVRGRDVASLIARGRISKVDRLYVRYAVHKSREMKFVRIECDDLAELWA